jgi:ParB-like nuclease domain
MPHRLEPLETIPQGALQPHPIAECWPLIRGKAFQELCQSISEHGLLTPVVLYEGRILDGRNRYRACQECQPKIMPTFLGYVGDDPIGYCKAQNDARRHLNVGQRASIASKLATLSQGRPESISRIRLVSMAEAAEEQDVSLSTTKEARAVQTKGVPCLNDLMDDGLVSPALAAKVATKATHELQTLFVEGVERGDKPSQLAKELLAETSEPLDLTVDPGLVAPLPTSVDAILQLAALLQGEQISEFITRLNREVQPVWKSNGWERKPKG